MAERLKGSWSEVVLTYPWDRWLDGAVWKLTQGEDFAITVRGFISLAHRESRRRGIRLRTRSRGSIVHLQAYGEDPRT